MLTVRLKVGTLMAICIKKGNKMKEVWMRLGIKIKFTEMEEALLFGENRLIAADTLLNILAEGRFEIDGDSYIPDDEKLVDTAFDL